MRLTPSCSEPMALTNNRPHAEERPKAASRSTRPPPSFETHTLCAPQDEGGVRRALGSVLAALIALGIAATAHAQTAPTADEIRIYAGLHEAAAKGDTAEIEKLVKEGERINIQDSRSRTPLHVAVYLKKHDAARLLLKLGANANALEIDRYDIVTIAAVANDLEMLKLALDGGASARNITSRYDGTALIAAAHLGHAEVVQMLIAAKAPLNHVNNLGWTALMESIVLGNGGKSHTDTLKALVDAGADVNIPDRQGTTPLQHARRRGYVNMARILEAAGAR
jgi:ankyrin repeat protein